MVFEAKELLKQKAIPVGLITAATYETFFAREPEGDLNMEEKRLLADFMQYNPHLEQERNLYKQTFLVADSAIVFENKNQLKQSVIPVRRIVFYALSAAASLALIMSVFFLVNQIDIPDNVAQRKNKTIKTKQAASQSETVMPDNQVAVTTQKRNAETPTSEQAIESAENRSQAGNKVVAPDTYSQAGTEIAAAYHHNIEPLLTKPANKVSTRHYVEPQFTFIRKSQMYMNDNLEFYYNLKLAEQIEYAELNKRDKNPAKTIMNAATEKAEDLFAMNRNTPAVEEKKNVSLWTFAELGVQTFNTITSSEVELKLRKDEEGKVIAYGFEVGFIDFEKEVKK